MDFLKDSGDFLKNSKAFENFNFPENFVWKSSKYLDLFLRDSGIWKKKEKKNNSENWN